MLLLSLLSDLSCGVERTGRNTSLYLTQALPLIGTSDKNGQDACSIECALYVIVEPETSTP